MGSSSYFYLLGEHRALIEALEDKEFVALSKLDGDAQGIATDYDFYDDWWKVEIQGISLFHLIEGMAHITSMQLADDEQMDALGFDTNPDYTTAFNFFTQSLKHDGLETRWKYLLFLYFCYFSCQHFNRVTDEDGLTPVKIFLDYCSRVDEYATKLKSLFDRYDRYSKNELLKLARWGLSRGDLKEASRRQIAAVYAFFELVESMEEDGFSRKDRSSVQTDKLSDFLAVSAQMNLDWQDTFMFAKMIIFPKHFVQVRELYDTVMGFSVGENEYSYSDEATFYKFVVNCKNILNPAMKLPCCETHGFLEDRRKVLTCVEEGGLSFYLKSLTSRPATELFKIWRPSK